MEGEAQNFQLCALLAYGRSCNPLSPGLPKTEIWHLHADLLLRLPTARLSLGPAASVRAPRWLPRPRAAPAVCSSSAPGRNGETDTPGGGNERDFGESCRPDTFFNQNMHLASAVSFWLLGSALRALMFFPSPARAPAGRSLNYWRGALRTSAPAWVVFLP